jgi:putative methyltransferase (TIGR04325 family)
MTRHYCTYFDHRYFSQGMVMIQSLKKYQPEAQVTVLCLSDLCQEWLRNFSEEGIQTMTLEDLQRSWPELVPARKSRSLIEFYFTCTPYLLREVLKKQEPDTIVTYLDADLGFFSSPEPLFTEMSEHAVAIIPHRFTPDFLKNEMYGKYNVGWVSFRYNQEGEACLNWWAERCLEWCYDRVEPERFADQKYLDQFQEKFTKVQVLRHPGANLAPWNVRSHQLSCKKNQLLVDGQPLIFFHYHGFKFTRPWLLGLPFFEYKVKLNPFLKTHIIKPWLQRVQLWQQGKAPTDPLIRNRDSDPVHWQEIISLVLRGASLITSLRLLTAEIFPHLALRFSRAKPKSDSLYFSGDFTTWEEARSGVCGYAATPIFEITRRAMRKIITGEAVFERDSVLMPVPEYPFSTIAGIMLAATQHPEKLAVLDFGGSLASTYYACRPWLDQIKELHWSIVEQPHYVECGRVEFSTSRLAFHHTLEESVAWQIPDLVLMSGSLQFLPDPMKVLDEIIALNPPFLLIERTYFWQGDRPRLVHQHVPAEIYPADYPCWLFCEKQLVERIVASYELIASYPAFDRIPLENGQSYSKGMLFRRKEK